MNSLVEITYESIGHNPERLRQLLAENKVVVLRSSSEEDGTLHFFEPFCEKVGTIINLEEDLISGVPTGRRWMDITYDPAIIDRYRTAPVAQPLHTDYSYIDIPDVVQFIYCVSQARLGGATTFMDANLVVKLLELSGEHMLFERLCELPVTFSKVKRQRKIPILRKLQEHWHFNWNYFCLDTDASKEESQLVDAFHTFLQTRVVPSGLLTPVRLEKGDAVFFHDELVLHGRNAYFATEKGERTLLKSTLTLQ
jgi:alpha-ketoglutarate-dependent taurine dioxygenase